MSLVPGRGSDEELKKMEDSGDQEEEEEEQGEDGVAQLARGGWVPGAAVPAVWPGGCARPR